MTTLPFKVNIFKLRSEINYTNSCLSISRSSHLTSAFHQNHPILGEPGESEQSDREQEGESLVLKATSLGEWGLARGRQISNARDIARVDDDAGLRCEDEIPHYDQNECHLYIQRWSLSRVVRL